MVPNRFFHCGFPLYMVKFINSNTTGGRQKKYEKEMAMTSEERKELHKWVASGRSPYDNGDYIYGENGWPMDFVSAMRFEADQMEWFASLSEEEKQALQGKSQQYDTELDEPISMYTGILDEGEEYLPF